MLPNRPKPDHSSVSKLVTKFEITGSVADIKKSGRPRIHFGNEIYSCEWLGCDFNTTGQT
jgi:hypothetical protein